MKIGIEALKEMIEVDKYLKYLVRRAITEICHEPRLKLPPYLSLRHDCVMSVNFARIK